VHLYTTEFHEIFAIHDSDSDGWIPINEMMSVLKGIGVNVTEDEIVQGAGGTDSNINSGKQLCFCDSDVRPSL